MSSIEATEVTKELVEVLERYSGKVCPHLHICLQSGSDRILRLMRRRWGTRMFLDRCQWIRERLHLPAFTTDVIVGFPSETDEDFEATCETARVAGFSKMHLFPFSPRKGTPAASFTEQVSPEVKQRRMEQLAALEIQLRDQYFQQLIGQPLQVVVENVTPLQSFAGPTRYLCRGTSCRYAQVQWVVDQLPETGSLVDVQVTSHEIGQDYLSAVPNRVS